ncbi:hypothetical protein FQN54_004545 [Arachnomyces sp. PD_36]|nr:hypothetical protein FQN54_004545 [Arachnomyces sp. PD_36]
MVYIMEIYTDGACRGNGRSWAIGAAASALMTRGSTYYPRKRPLPDYPTPTNQRAEITAIILALEQALEKYEELHSYPDLKVKIFSDSRYAIGCMTDWVYKWANNGWRNAAGNEVVNRDLIEEASDLDDRLKREGKVEYIWIPRSQNQIADELCNECLDDM